MNNIRTFGYSVFLLFVFSSVLVTSCMKMDDHSDRMAADERMDIVETAISAGSFSTLTTALTKAGLVETLKGPGPFTVFAPTDEAFSKLPADTLENLLKPENREKLVSILTYHVVPENVTSAQVVKLDSAETVNGKEVNIKVRNGTVMVDNATVITADIMASNGVIHVIDEVILP